MWTLNVTRPLSDAMKACTLAAALVASAGLAAQTCPFDNGGSTLENDGLVLTRYALGLRGAPMVANTSFAGGDVAAIESNIACPSCGLRVTDDKDALNNPIFTAADATIISRKIAGFSGAALTNGVALGSGSRSNAAAVQSFLLAGCGTASNGWAQGGNLFGAPGVVGTNDLQPLTVKAGGDSINVLMQSQGGLRMRESVPNSQLSKQVTVVNGHVSNRANSGTVGGTIAGGGEVTSAGSLYNNVVGGDFGSIGGGSDNFAGIYATVSGGNSNQANGFASTVIGGQRNFAIGRNSVAIGYQATARGFREMTFNNSDAGFDPQTQGLWGGVTEYTINMKAQQGVYFQAGSSTGCTLAAGGTGWFCASDRNLKEKIVEVSPRAVLEKVASLPVSTWVIKGYEQLHMGPMAQDFRAVFGLGRDDKTINSTDAQGVALAAIQGLNLKLNEKIKAKDDTIAKLTARLAAIEKRLGFK